MSQVYGNQRDIERLYAALRRLEAGLGGKRRLSGCDGRMDWPRRGLYLLFESGEWRRNGRELRVVRVGTHAVSRGAGTTLWNRLHTHLGGTNGIGRHRASVLRRHIGDALAAHDPSLFLPTWGVGAQAPADTRRSEDDLERLVSRHVGAMSVLWLAVEDAPGPDSDRAYLERHLIALLGGAPRPVDPPSAAWLGRHSPHEVIRDSGLWNVRYVDWDYAPHCLDVLEAYVSVTLGQAPAPEESLAPANWRSSK